jgi:hypothetical protein
VVVVGIVWVVCCVVECVTATECVVAAECVLTGACWAGAVVETGAACVVDEKVVVGAIAVDVCATVAVWCLRLCRLWAGFFLAFVLVVVLLVVVAAAAVAEVVVDFEALEPQPATASATTRIGSNARLIAPRPTSRRPRFPQYRDPRRGR